MLKKIALFTLFFAASAGAQTSPALTIKQVDENGYKEVAPSSKPLKDKLVKNGTEEETPPMVVPDQNAAFDLTQNGRLRTVLSQQGALPEVEPAGDVGTKVRVESR